MPHRQAAAPEHPSTVLRFHCRPVASPPARLRTPCGWESECRRRAKRPYRRRAYVSWRRHYEECCRQVYRVTTAHALPHQLWIRLRRPSCAGGASAMLFASAVYARSRKVILAAAQWHTESLFAVAKSRYADARGRARCLHAPTLPSSRLIEGRNAMRCRTRAPCARPC